MQPADRQAYCLNPLADPPMATDFVLIESASRALAPAAEAFAQVLQAEMAALDAAWRGEVAQVDGVRTSSRDRRSPAGRR
jgi:hypothetical protein